MRGKASIALLLVASAALVLGVIHLFQLRFEPGDLFAEYSSFRADPLGTKALYDGVGKLPGVQVRRSTTPLAKLKASPQTVLLFLAAHASAPGEDSLEVVEGLETVAAQGGRVVISFYPEMAERDFAREQEIPKSLREIIQGIDEEEKKSEEKDKSKEVGRNEGEKKPQDESPSADNPIAPSASSTPPVAPAPEAPPSVSEPSVPEPSVSEPSVSEPSVSEPSAPEAPAPAPSASEASASEAPQASEAAPLAQTPPPQAQEAPGDTASNAQQSEPSSKEDQNVAKSEEKEAGGQDKEESAKQKLREEQERYGRVYCDLTKRWAIDLGFKRLQFDEKGVAQSESARLVAQAPLPPYVSLRTTLYFVPKSEDWRTIYARQGEPVLIERDWGRGTIVFCADSYFLSNEAMRNDRQPALLAWLFGGHSDVVFDEWHLGVSQSPGVMSLVRKYRLESVLLSLILLAALYIWRNGTYLVPPREEAWHVDAAAGKDAHSGFVNLLRRSIPPHDLLSLCVEEWKRDALRQGFERSARDACANAMKAIVELQTARPPKERDWPAAYRKISTLIAERKAHRER